MKACWCTLPLTNPRACEGCPNSNEFGIPNDLNKGNPYKLPVYPSLTPPIRRIVEEFDEKGRLTRRTIEEDLFPSSPMYKIDFGPESTTVGDPTEGLPTTTCTTGDTNATK